MICFSIIRSLKYYRKTECSMFHSFETNKMLHFSVAVYSFCVFLSFVLRICRILFSIKNFSTNFFVFRFDFFLTNYSFSANGFSCVFPIVIQFLRSFIFLQLLCSLSFRFKFFTKIFYVVDGNSPWKSFSSFLLTRWSLSFGINFDFVSNLPLNGYDWEHLHPLAAIFNLCVVFRLCSPSFSFSFRFFFGRSLLRPSIGELIKY